ncbi:hypothetical protein ALC60_08824 [Trachymyrmex zeteki]|uniref:Uncharacterized protein n=1 Tax=Mycetomoellerius zeteki TaxID=64791 RepID=A0A151WW92_9HYME|nr:hypothetical protein ALC60_08824 [Trachymyrmex zeteki]
MWPRRDANCGRGSSAADNEGNCTAVTNAQLYQAYPTVGVNNHRRTVRVRENAMETDGNERTEPSLDGARVSVSVAWSVLYLLSISNSWTGWT